MLNVFNGIISTEKGTTKKDRKIDKGVNELK